MNKRKIKKIVFPVGGLGTRFLPATKSMPKEMLPVVDKPLIQYAFEEAIGAGIEQFIFITGRNKNVLSNHFDHSYELQKVLGEKEKKQELSLVKDWLPKAGNIAFVRQQEPLGLGHAVWCARNFIGNDPFAIILADELIHPKKNILKEMCKAYEDVNSSIIASARIDKKDTKKYGIIEPGTEKAGLIKIKGMVEKPEPSKAPSDLSITGRYILEPQIIDYLDTQINSAKGVDGEIQLTDAMNKMAKKYDFYAYEFKEKRFDCGSKHGFLEANIAFALERDDMRENVKKIIKEYSKNL